METLKTKIDKIINKTGPLRVPSYWMNHLLNDIVDKTENDISTLSKKTDNSFSQKISLVKKYTYIQLCELRDRGQLIPGQQYLLTDYTPILNEDYSDFTIENPSRNILLTAESKKEFYHNAIYCDDYGIEILFCFHNDEWAPKWTIDNADSIEQLIIMESDKEIRLQRVDEDQYEVYEDNVLIGSTSSSIYNCGFGQEESF